MSWLDKIREKDDSLKTTFAFWSALIITLVIVLIWAFNLPYLFQKNENNGQTASPIQSVWNRVETIFDFGPEIYKVK